MNLNKAILAGNITRDIELKALPSAVKVASFSIATNRVWKDNAGKKNEHTEFHNVVAFGKTAEVIAQYCKKGDGIYIEGRLQTRNWEKDGVKQYRTEIVLETFQFGAKRGKTENQNSESQEVESNEPTVQTEEDITEDMIPF